MRLPVGEVGEATLEVESGDLVVRNDPRILRPRKSNVQILNPSGLKSQDLAPLKFGQKYKIIGPREDGLYTIAAQIGSH